MPWKSRRGDWIPESIGKCCARSGACARVSRYISDKIAVMYLGKIVEIGGMREVIENPLHPYSKALFSAVRSPNPDLKLPDINIKGEISDPINLPPGCRFYPRCPFASNICKKKEPDLVEKEEHLVACNSR